MTPCVRCEGSGEVWTGDFELDTHAPVTTRCPDCLGDGTTRPEEDQ